MNKAVFPFVGCLCALLMTGCSMMSRECVDPKSPYLTAENKPPLKVPEGMMSPDRGTALVIPPASATAPAPVLRRTATQRCLEDPPPYYSAPKTQDAAPKNEPATPAPANA